MSKKIINETKTKSLTREQKTSLLHSVARYLANHGLPQTLGRILSEAQIEGEQWKSSPVDLEELYCKYLDTCDKYTVASSSSSIIATNKLCPNNSKHKLLPTKEKGHICEACKDLIYGIGSELKCRKCDPDGPIYFHDFCVGACPSVKYRFATDGNSHRRTLSLTHAKITRELKCNGCRGDIKGSRYTGGNYDLHPECAVNLVKSATNNLGVDAENMTKIYSRFRINNKHVYDNMRSELHKLLPRKVNCYICNQHNTGGKSSSECEWSCVTTCQREPLGWHFGCVRRRLIAPKNKWAITIDPAGSAGGENKIGLEDVLELLMEVGIGFLPLPPPISILLAIGFKVVAYQLSHGT